MARAHQAGSSSAAVPRFTRAQPVDSARCQRVVVADPAGQLHGHVQLADHVGQQLGVGAAAERGVEVDQVDPLGAVGLPLQRGVQRGAVAGLGAGLALDQPHGLPVRDVDGGQQREAHSAEPTQRDRCPSRAPPIGAHGTVAQTCADGPVASRERAGAARRGRRGRVGGRRRARRARRRRGRGGSPTSAPTTRPSTISSTQPHHGSPASSATSSPATAAPTALPTVLAVEARRRRVGGAAPAAAGPTGGGAPLAGGHAAISRPRRAASCAAASPRRRRTSPGGTGWRPASRSPPRPRSPRRGAPR